MGRNPRACVNFGGRDHVERGGPEAVALVGFDAGRDGVTAAGQNHLKELRRRRVGRITVTAPEHGYFCPLSRHEPEAICRGRSREPVRLEWAMTNVEILAALGEVKCRIAVERARAVPDVVCHERGCRVAAGKVPAGDGEYDVGSPACREPGRRQGRYWPLV